MLGMMIYLDRRFELHQRLAAMMVILLEGLVEIEREIGLLRKGGEGLSVLWEAFVRGTIGEFIRCESSPLVSDIPNLNLLSLSSAGQD